MVYCGAPSRACHACRARKTKCDAIVGGCTQCKRARRFCPGYRDSVNAIFRNENERIRRKLLRDPTRNSQQEKKSRAATEERLNQAEDITEVSIIYEGISPALNLSAEDRARCFFVWNFAQGIDGPSYGFVDNIIERVRISDGSDSLNACIDATSQTVYGCYIHDQRLIISAKQKYITAVKQINAALSSPTLAVRDSTLSSILLLGLCEVLTNEDVRSPSAWVHHLSGAVELLRLRGKEQFNSLIGVELFFQATTGIMLRCIHEGLPFPPHLVTMNEEFYSDASRKMTPTAQAGFQFHMLAITGCQFFARVGRSDVSQLDALLNEANRLESSLTSIHDNVPLSWQYTISSAGKKAPDVFFPVARTSLYHGYSNMRLATTWNNLRIFRCLISLQYAQLMQRDQLRAAPKFDSGEYTIRTKQCNKICRQMQKDIVTSVPWYLGCLPDHSVLKDAPLRMSNAYYLIWPLYVAGALDPNSPVIRAYCGKILLRIGSDYGIQPALRLGKLLEKQYVLSFD